MESIREKKIETIANKIAESKKYKPYVEALQKSPLSKLRSISSYDVYALGSQLEAFETYKNFCSEAGTSAELGPLPKVAFDVITAVYGAGIIPVASSVQSIEEEQGIVYFKQLKAGNSRGNITADDVLFDAVNQPKKFPRGFAGSRASVQPLYSGSNTTGGFTNATTEYSGTLAVKPLRPNTLKVYVETLTLSSGAVTSAVRDANIYGMDDGNGTILGKGLYGTINYETGAWTLNLTEAPTVDASNSSRPIFVFDQDFEADGTTIGEYKYVLTGKSIQAQVFALREQIGLLKSFSLQKRFGKASEDEMMNDLVNGLTEEAGGALIFSLIEGARSITGNSVEWNKFSYQDWTTHKLSFIDKLYEAEGKIYTNAGRGKVNVVIAGATAASWLQSMPTFKPINNTVSGPHVVGTIGDITVIRVPSTILGVEETIALYKGTGAFDTPAIWAPYMPLFASGSIPVLNNPMMKQGLVATWAGCETVVPQFVTEIKVINEEFPTA